MANVHLVNTMGAAAALSEWLGEQYRLEEPVSVAFKARSRKLALASVDDAFVVDMQAATFPLVQSLLSKALHDGNLALRFRDARFDVAPLVPVFRRADGDPLDDLLGSIAGDLTAAAYCLNQPVQEHAKFQRVENDAFDIALLTGQYEHAVPRYYGAVGIPMAKIHAESKYRKPATTDWWVSYRDLYIKVLAHQSGDPTLISAFNSGYDVAFTVGRLFNETKPYGEMTLLWLSCGLDVDVFKRRFPTYLQGLPKDLDRFEEDIKLHLPNLWMAVDSIKQGYIETRSATTLYGRKLRPGHPHGEAVAHRIFGTVDDLIAVACVTFWQNRTSRDILLTEVAGSHASPEIRIKGAGPGKVGVQRWMTELYEVSTLGDPLGNLLLTPQVTFP